MIHGKCRFASFSSGKRRFGLGLTLRHLVSDNQRQALAKEFQKPDKACGVAGVSLFELFLPVLEVLKSLPPPLNHEKRRHGYFIGTQREAGRLLNHEQCRHGSLLEEPY